ncbi:MAG: hypothetical protein K2O03_10115, partial [Lachnospiraceae bacterium]|nr:hypothetical protein [Lachnospiraceae bacterium]
SVNSLKGREGDPSDNITGVPGIGEMTAAALIHEYGSVEHLYEVLKAQDEKGQKALVQDWKVRLGIKRSPLGPLLKTSDTELVGERAAMLSKTLATIKRDIPLDVTLEQLRVAIDKETALKEFEALEFRSLRFEEPEEEGDFVPVSENPFEGDGFAAVGSSPFGADGGARSAARSASASFELMMNPPVSEEALQDSLVSAGNAQPANSTAPASAAQLHNAEKTAVADDDKTADREATARAAAEKIKFPPYTEPEDIVHTDMLPQELLSGKTLVFTTLSEDASLLSVALQGETGRIYFARPSAEEFTSYLSEAVKRGVRPVTLGLKEQLAAFDTEKMREIALSGGLLDIELAAYLKNPLTGAYAYDELAKEYYGISLPQEKELLKKLAPR